MTRYMGVDPGYSRCGWGVIEDTDGQLKMIDCGTVTTPADSPFPDRLSTVLVSVSKILADYAIDVLGVERPIHGQNVTNSVEVGAAYGAVLLAGVDMDIPTSIHFPTQVKAAVANGRASKSEVLAGVMVVLSLDIPPRPDDAADALAVAVCARDQWNQAQIIKSSM